jgi:GDP-L-fucose synthase
MINKNTKIFIAGHKGLVGSSIYTLLKKKNFKNIIVKSKSELNLLDSIKVDKFFKKNKIELVIFCAGLVGGIKANSKYSTEFFNQNMLMIINALSSSHKYDVKNFLNLGSACIYPKNIKRKLKESDLLKGELEKTNEPYALAKISALKLCNYYRKQFNRDYYSLMPANLFGKNDNFNLENSHVIPALIRKFYEAKKFEHKHVEVFGDGKSVRDFLYVEDLALAIFFTIKNLHKKEFKKTISEFGFLNVGYGKGIKIISLINKIKQISNFKRKIVFKYKNLNGTRFRVLSSSRLTSKGWKNKYSFDNGLKITFNWYKNNTTKRN